MSLYFYKYTSLITLRAPPRSLSAAIVKLNMCHLFIFYSLLRHIFAFKNGCRKCNYIKLFCQYFLKTLALRRTSIFHLEFQECFVCLIFLTRYLRYFLSDAVSRHH